MKLLKKKESIVKVLNKCYGDDENKVIPEILSDLDSVKMIVMLNPWEYYIKKGYLTFKLKGIEYTNDQFIVLGYSNGRSVMVFKD